MHNHNLRCSEKAKGVRAKTVYPSARPAPGVAGRLRHGIMDAEAPMIQTVEAVIDESGRVVLLGEVRVDAPRRALVTVLDEPAVQPDEAALLAEAALAVDWSRPEEDAAWSHLQPAK